MIDLSCSINADVCWTDESDTFTARLVAKVVANLQLFIEKIHIRYEDDTQNAKVPETMAETDHRVS